MASAFFRPGSTLRNSRKNGLLLLASFGSIGLCASISIPLAGQAQPASRERGFGMLLGNMAIGGGTAAARAVLNRKDPVRAFAIGSLGGVAHFAGKVVGSRQTGPSGLAAVTIGSIGTSIVVNAGQGRAAFSRLYVPLGPFRLRFEHAAATSFTVSLNVFEAAVAGRMLARSGLEVNWRRSISNATPVFEARSQFVVVDGDTVNGLTTGGIVVVSDLAPDLWRTLLHEGVHVQQYRFLDEAWGQPIEQFFRKRITALQRLPTWMEFGVVAPALRTIDRQFHSGEYNGFLVRIQEAEADWFERR